MPAQRWRLVSRINQDAYLNRKPIRCLLANAIRKICAGKHKFKKLPLSYYAKYGECSMIFCFSKEIMFETLLK